VFIARWQKKALKVIVAANKLLCNYHGVGIGGCSSDISNSFGGGEPNHIAAHQLLAPFINSIPIDLERHASWDYCVSHLPLHLVIHTNTQTQCFCFAEQYQMMIGTCEASKRLFDVV
jgi:hypothetical protein